MLKFWCVSFRDSATCMLSTTRPRRAVESNRVRRKISAGAFHFALVACPAQKITVGCVIFTVPRRNKVNHAVTDDTPSASVETVIDKGSAMHRSLALVSFA